MLARPGHRLSLVVLIQGVDRVFKEATTFSYATAFGGTRPETACITSNGVDIGLQELDIVSRAVKGGDLSLTLMEPSGSTVLRDIFRSRARRTSYVTVTCTRTDVAISMVTTSLPASGTVYIGGETITYTSKSGTQILGCTRGAYGSRAQPHLASTAPESASGVYIYPPSWVGRRVYVKGVFLDELGAGATATADYQDLGTFTIDEPPQVSNTRTWRLTCAPLSEELAKKKAYVGLDAATPTNAPPEVVAAEGTWKIYLDNASQFRLSGATAYEHVAMRFDGAFPRNMLGRMAGASTVTDPDYLIVIPEPGMTWPGVSFGSNGSSAEAYAVASVKRIFFGTVRARKALAYMLTSNKGDGTNSSYDVLYGLERDDGVGKAYRMGCGINSADIDLSSIFQAAPGVRWAYCLDETVSASDILKEFCWLTDSFWVVANGALTIKKMRDVKTAATLTIDSSVYVPGTIVVSYSEKMIFPVVKLRTNYSPFSGEYELTTSVTDQELLERFPGKEDMLELSFKGVGINNLPDNGGNVTQSLKRPCSMTFEEAQTMVREWQRNFARGLVTVELKAKITAVAVNVGDVVTLNLPTIYDFDGGTLTAVTARIIARGIDLGSGQVTLRMFVMEQVFLVTPSDELTSVSTTTLANDTIGIAGGSTTNYAVGMSVRLWDASTSTSNVLTIAALPSATSMRFTTSPTFVPVIGEDWVTWNTNGTNVATAPANGYRETDYSYQMPEPAVAAAGSVRRWR